MDLSDKLLDKVLQPKKGRLLIPDWLQLNKELTHNQRRFLAAFAITGTILGASRAAKLDRSNHYEWMRDSVPYAEAFAIAKEQSIEALEEEARRRATEGTLEPVYQGGKLVGYNRRQSDTLLMFLLNGEKPQKYKQRTELSGPGGGPIHTVDHKGLDLSTVSDEELAKERKKLEQLTTGIISPGN